MVEMKEWILIQEINGIRYSVKKRLFKYFSTID